MRAIYIFFILIVLFTGCKKLVYYPDKTIPVETTRILAHRGGGNAQFRDNTLAGIKSALRWKDGIEVDVQLSKNGTVWLSHSSEVVACDQTFRCFAETPDDDIKSITSCNGQDISYTQLEDVFRFIRDSFPDKQVSLDIKPWGVCGINSVDVEGTMRYEGENILNLAKQYNLEGNIKFETETASVLGYIQSKTTKAEIYLTAFGDFELAMVRCLKEKYTGISYKNNDGEMLTKEKIDLLHRKGLRIMVWNLASSDEIPELTQMGVDYIQQDL
ncbi:MAG: glycerophosphodiester phosphodiesterase [Bacteroidetes bacterium]|nr:glycerophosphodiester phosphodiesterase [Bacteroidota bacterium]